MMYFPSQRSVYLHKHNFQKVKLSRKKAPVAKNCRIIYIEGKIKFNWIFIALLWPY